MEEGLKELNGAAGMIAEIYKNNIITWKDIKSWVEMKKSNPAENPIPDKFKNSIMVLDESICTYQNFEPDTKQRLKFNICSALDDLDDLTALCLLPEGLSDSIDFSQDSKVVTIGRVWLPDPNPETGDVNIIIMTSGMYAYEDWKMPMNTSAKKIDVSNFVNNQEKNEEETEN